MTLRYRLLIILPVAVFLPGINLSSLADKPQYFLETWAVIAWSSINRSCFFSAITVLIHLFKRNVFILAGIGTHSFNWLWSLLSVKELPAFGWSNFTYIALQSGFDFISKYLTVPTESLIYLSETLILSVNITLASTYNFYFAGRFAVWVSTMLSGLDVKHMEQQTQNLVYQYSLHFPSLLSKHLQIHATL